MTSNALQIREKTKVGTYLVVDDLAGLVALAQLDILEIHTWSSTTDALEQPDRIVMDLDPGPAVAWKEVVAAAREVRDAFTALGLTSLVKTTGGNGLHVVVPIVPEHDVATCLAFSKGVAETIAAARPRRYTTAMAKEGREDKILLDYLRNNRTNTAVAAYSMRAKPNAPVSVPLAWDELSARKRSDAWTVETVMRRLRGLDEDPWGDWGTRLQRLELVRHRPAGRAKVAKR